MGILAERTFLPEAIDHRRRRADIDTLYAEGHRITSYNVCYTKLLRGSLLRGEGAVEAVATEIRVGHAAFDVGASLALVDPELEELTIVASYGLNAPGQQLEGTP